MAGSKPGRPPPTPPPRRPARAAFAPPFGGEVTNLAHHVDGTTRDLLATHERDDAERAGVVAADRDRDPRRVRHLAVGRQRRGDVIDRTGLFPDLRNRT